MSAAAHGTPAQVLVIDDSAGVRAEIARVLGARGITVASCASGYEAVARLPGAPPDLLICDLVLPDVDGYQICRWLRQVPRLAATRVLLISSIVDDEVEREVQKLGVVGVLKKPLDPAVLLAVVERVLGIGGAAAAEPAAEVAMDLAPDATSHAPAETVLDLAPDADPAPAGAPSEQVIDLSPAGSPDAHAAGRVVDLGRSAATEPERPRPSFAAPAAVQAALPSEARQILAEMQELAGFRFVVRLAAEPALVVLALAGEPVAAGAAPGGSERLSPLLAAADGAAAALGLGRLGAAVLDADAGTLVVRRETANPAGSAGNALVLLLASPAAVGKARLLLARLERALPADLDAAADEAPAN